jgi:outer membrane protein assembly factor BamE (lipoprotein component of BamABCDE complex)
MQKTLTLLILAVALASAGGPIACRKNAAPSALVSKLNKTTYDQIRPGMTKSQVETLLGAPTTVETKDFVVYKKTIYRYQEGSTFVNLSFKNDELDTKDTNLGTGAP